jgi:hypothetical protein
MILKRRWSGISRATQQAVAQMPRYPWTAERMTREWIALFESLLEERRALIASRRLWRNPLTVLANQMPF